MTDMVGLSPEELRKLRLSRQADIIPDASDLSILFVGVGGIGSNAVAMAVSMGFSNITLIDPDNVANENVYPGSFSDLHIGMNKAEAVVKDVTSRYGIPEGSGIVWKPTRYDSSRVGEYNIVVISTDNIPSRRLVWLEQEIICPSGHWIDARMGGYLSTVITLDVTNPIAVKTYNEFIMTEEAGSLPCGEKATAPLTKGFIAGMIGQSLERILTGKPALYTQRYDLGMALHLTVETEKLT